MGFTQAARAQFVRSFDFSGRSSRSEYWYAILFNSIVSIALSIIDIAIGYNVFTTLFSLIVFIATVSLPVRRLHDTGRSGWWLLAPLLSTVLSVIAGVLAGKTIGIAILGIGLLACFGSGIAILVWFCRAGSPGTNRFGPNPLGLELPAT